MHFSLLNILPKSTFPRILMFCSGLTLLSTLSCGRAKNLDLSNSQSTLHEWKNTAVLDRFSVQDIAGVYTEETTNADGKLMPVSKRPNVKAFSNSDPALANEWGDYSVGGEIKAYLNLGYVPSPGFQDRLVRTLQTISDLKSIRTDSGKSIFVESYTIDERGLPIGDVITGKASPDGTLARGFLDFKPTKALPMNATLPINIIETIYNRDGVLQFELRNSAAVSVPLAGGTLVKSGMLRVHLKFYPHKKGWLIYGVSLVKIEKHPEALDPQAMAEIVSALFGWLKANVILPLR